MTSCRRPIALAGILALSFAVPTVARAQDTANAPSAEARERFERGLRLFNAGDDAGALAEFTRSYGLSANVVALYNMALVYADMGRAVEALEALDRVLAAPGALSTAKLAIARQRRDEQALRVGSVAMAASVQEGTVEVDGIEAAKLPLGSTLHVATGEHVIGVIAQGFEPARKEVTVAGGQTQSLRFDLVAMAGHLAHLTVKTHLPGADVFVDDQRVAVTPLTASITLAPGSHRLELRRAGYNSAQSAVRLDDGASGEVTLEPEEDRAALGSGGGELAIAATEGQPVITVDGRLRGVYAGPLRVMHGPHHLLVERGDFEPAERDVNVEPGASSVVRVSLEPTPDYRARYESHAQTVRTWGIVAIVGGAAIAGAGVGLLFYDAGQRRDGNATYHSLLSQTGPGQPCEQPMPLDYGMTCSGPVNAAAAKANDANTRDIAAWGAVGVGAAAAVLGVTLLAVGDNPHRYDAPSSDKALGLRATPSFWAVHGGGGVGLSGAF